ncbi:cobalt-precorrin-4 C(11)-methyltransferase [Archaeoglobales archaeon]|nr:MAG: cobalt-precorrin-4 C(11)-methyltransferase [Archaeoglobales archaeon]
MKVYFVGFGPGNPELLTVKGYNLLKEADLIVYPGSLINKEYLDQFEAEKINSFGLKLEEIVDIIEKAVKNGKKVVRLQSGDPSIYGAIGEQMKELEKRGIECEVVPGVSSVFASAAAIKRELTTPEVPGIVITRPKGKTLDEDYLDVLASTPLTLIILLGVDKIDYVVEKVGKVRGFDEPCAVVYHASRDSEKVIVSKLADIAKKVKKEGIKRTATIIIGKAVEGYKGRSILYG